jgi:hypothetical protein
MVEGRVTESSLYRVSRKLYSGTHPTVEILSPGRGDLIAPCVCTCVGNLVHRLTTTRQQLVTTVMAFTQAFLEDDVESFKRYHSSGGYKIYCLDIANLGPFCVNQKLFKVYQYIAQIPYEDIRTFLLRFPYVWKDSSHYKHFKDFCEAQGVARPGEVAQLRQEVADLKEKVTALWYSPGMPGYVLAQNSFEEGQQLRC